MAGSDSWRKAPADLVARFHEAVAGIDGVKVRKMFGYPAAFIGGNLTAGLYQESAMVRLSDAEREERMADGWSRFEPMPGRPMREYVVLPEAWRDDSKRVREWAARALDHADELPPKQPKKSQKKK